VRLTAAVTLLLLFAPASPAQERGYAGPAELNGKRRVYVEAGGKSRARIVDELRKSRTGVEVVDAPGAAELILSFSAEKVKTFIGLQTEPEYFGQEPLLPKARYDNIEYGFGSAYAPTADGGRRVFFIWEKQKKLAGSAGKFANAFLKEYRKANGLRTPP
jgi:hypothetical protein